MHIHEVVAIREREIKIRFVEVDAAEDQMAFCNSIISFQTLPPCTNPAPPSSSRQISAGKLALCKQPFRGGGNVLY